MKKFDVLINQEGRIELVKQGFNWLAFWFTLIWSIFKLHLVNSILVVAAYIMIVTLFNLTKYDDNIVFDFMAVILSLSFNIIFGLYGNKWNKERLLKNNYKLAGTVEGEFYSEAYRDAQRLIEKQSPDKHH